MNYVLIDVTHASGDILGVLNNLSVFIHTDDKTVDRVIFKVVNEIND